MTSIPDSPNPCEYDSDQPTPPPDDCGVYALLNTRTGKVYVGSSVELRKRCYTHVWYLDRGTHHNRHLQNAWNKDHEHFAVGILEHCSSSNVRDRERYWIQELQVAVRQYGYNLSDACDQRFINSPETRAKLSETNRNRSPETRAKISIANARRIHSPESRAKMSASRCNPSPETRAKLSAASRGTVRTPEWRAKIGAANSNPSPETRAKLSASQRNASPEWRAKIAEAGRRRIITPEIRANMSAGQRARQARERAERGKQEELEG